MAIVVRLLLRINNFSNLTYDILGYKFNFYRSLKEFLGIRPTILVEKNPSTKEILDNLHF